jgi:hypothetical protein
LQLPVTPAPAFVQPPVTPAPTVVRPDFMQSQQPLLSQFNPQSQPGVDFLNIFAENWQKSQKIVIITSTPGVDF